jgi:Fe-S-cluster containining protein
VPRGLADTLNAHTCRMRGTDNLPARCAALTGVVGSKVGCGIYEWRPSPCREFEEGSDACGRARSKHGLAPLNQELS